MFVLTTVTSILNPANLSITLPLSIYWPAPPTIHRGLEWPQFLNCSLSVLCLSANFLIFLLLDTGVTRPNIPSMDLVPDAEERGRLRKAVGGKKKALRALEERPPDPVSPGKGSNKWKSVKRLRGSSQGKSKKDVGTGERGQVALMKMWLESGKGGSGSRKAQEEEN